MKQWKKNKGLTHSKALETSKNLNKKKSLDRGKEIKVRVICNHSESNSGIFFNNKVEAIDLNTTVRTYINKILNLDGKLIKISELPFNKKSEFLEINSRIENIFMLYGIECHNNEIFKCSYDSPLQNYGYNYNKDFLRIFIKMENKELLILLIDPYHLVATSKYHELYDQNSNKFNYCLSNLKNLSIYD